MELTLPMPALPRTDADDEAAAPPAVQGSDDSGLAAAFRAGDGRAFEALVRRHQRVVLAVALKMLGDADAAEDVAQRAFIRALDGAAAWRGESTFRSWVLAIVVNLARNHVRDHARVASLPQPGTLASVGESPDERLDRERRRARLRAAVETLPPRQREVVLLRIDGELSFADVARSLQITENAAKVSFHLGVKRLKELLGEER